MLPIWILSVSFLVLGADAMVNEPIAAGPQIMVHDSSPPLPNQQSLVPQNFVQPPLNHNTENKFILTSPPLLPPQSAASHLNVEKCPNTAILLNILNILTNSLPQTGKTILEPEKFKYVLTVVKNFLETMPLNPENYDMYNKFKNIEGQFDKIIKRSLNSIDDDKLRAKIPLQYNLSAEHYSRCQEIFNSLMKFINTAYSQVLRYCLTTENCGIKSGNSFPYTHSDTYRNPYVYNGIQFYPLAPIQRNSTYNFLLPSETNSKDSKTAGADLLNFIKHQEQKGVNNIMSVLQNYRPHEVNNIPGNEMKSSNGVQNPQLFLNPGNNQAPNILAPVNQYNGKHPSLQPSNIYKSPNGNNAVSWQTVFSGIKVIPGNNPPFENYLAQKFYEGNNAVYPSVETSYFVNGQIVPIQTGVPNVNPRETTYPNIKNVPGLIMNPNEKQNIINTNMKILQIPKFGQSIQNLQNVPQQTAYYQNQYPEPLEGINNQLHNPYLPSNNPIFPTSKFTNTIYNNGQNNILTDNTKQGNYGGELSDLNRMLGVTNLAKLNTIPHSNGVVELTYLFKRPQPVNEQKYYVKYRMPYQAFLYNLQNLLIKKPNLRNEPNLLYQELLVGSNVTDASKDLKGLNHNDLLKLTSTNGTLVAAKILEGNDTAIIDKPLKIVQKLNSKLPVENLINFNMNSTKNIRLETQQKLNGNMNSSTTNDFLKNIYPRFFDARKGTYPNSVYPMNTIGQNLQNQPNLPYSVYQNKPIRQIGIPLIRYGAALPNVIVKKPTLYLPYVGTNHYPQFGR